MATQNCGTGQVITADSPALVTLTGETPNSPTFTLETAGALSLATESPSAPTIGKETGIMGLFGSSFDPCNVNPIADVALARFDGNFLFDGKLLFNGLTA